MGEMRSGSGGRFSDEIANMFGAFPKGLLERGDAKKSEECF